MAWTRAVAQERGKYNITLNSVVPAIRTPMYDAYMQRLPEERRMMHDMAMQHMISLGGKLGDADADMAPVMVFLASDAPRFITGQAFVVDSGMIMLG